MNQDRDPRFEHTEQVIRSTFLDMLRRLKYESVTVRELTAQAPINRKTFYLHYDSLDRLLGTMRTESTQKSYDKVKDCRIPDDIPQLVRTLYTYWDSLGEDDFLLWTCTPDRKIGTTFAGQLLTHGMTFTGRGKDDPAYQHVALLSMAYVLSAAFIDYTGCPHHTGDRPSRARSVVNTSQQKKSRGCRGSFFMLRFSDLVSPDFLNSILFFEQQKAAGGISCGFCCEMIFSGGFSQMAIRFLRAG